MPTSKTIYIADNDVPLFAKVTQITGSVSAAVKEGLEIYLERYMRAQGDFQEVEVDLYKRGVRQTVAFYARQLTRVVRHDEDGTRVDVAYLTVKHQIAVVTTLRLDQQERSTGDDVSWDVAEEMDGKFFENGTTELNIYSSVRRLQINDPELAEICDRALSTVAYERLDI